MNNINIRGRKGIKRIRPGEVDRVIEKDDEIVMPVKKFFSLFPLATRRNLEVYAVYEDDKFVIVSTYLPEQKSVRLKKVPKMLLYGNIRDLVKYV